MNNNNITSTVEKKTNGRLITTANNDTTPNKCNRRKKDQCSFHYNCLNTSVIYKGRVAIDKDNTGKNYIGRKEEMFKLSFRNRKYANRTELARKTTR